MYSEFKGLAEQMPELLGQLSKQPLRPWNNLGELPEKGIYVFYENSKPIYVGRTKNMRRRLKEHGNRGSTHYSSTFAFKIAKKEADKAGIDIRKTRNQLEKDPAFATLFAEAKARVSNMSVRTIPINDPIRQTLFEVYASIALDTREYNDFDTH